MTGSQTRGTSRAIKCPVKNVQSQAPSSRNRSTIRARLDPAAATTRQLRRTAALRAVAGGGDHALQLQTSALPPPPAVHEGLPATDALGRTRSKPGPSRPVPT